MLTGLFSKERRKRFINTYTFLSVLSVGKEINLRLSRHSWLDQKLLAKTTSSAEKELCIEFTNCINSIYVAIDR